MSAYRKLTRKKRTLVSSTQLWLGDDHVLMVRSTRFIEEYRRFQLSDIQAVVACEAPQRFLLQIGFTVFGFVLLTSILGVDSMYGRVFFALCGMLCLAVAAYDMVRGARCTCRLLTEVSAEPVDPVTRVSDYQRLMVELQPAIEAAQGRLSVEEQATILDGVSGPAAFVKPAPPPLGAQKYLQHALYMILLVNAVAYAVGYLWKVEEALSLAISILLAEIILAILLVLRPSRFGVEGLMKALLAVIAVLIVLDTFSAIGQVGYLLYAVAENGRQNLKPPVFWEIPSLMLLGKISITWRLLAGLTGLAALWMGREAAPSQPPPQA